MEFNVEPLLKREKQPPKCKGIFFRAQVNNFFNGVCIGFRTDFRLLKRKSCPGCDQCDSLLDDAKERMSPSYSEMIGFPKDVKHGDLFELRVTNISVDWESGHADDWDIELVPVKEAP